MAEFTQSEDFPGEKTESAPRHADAIRSALATALPAFRKADELVGRLIMSDYAILDLLGQGGMAKVYKAKQISTDRFVAIKTLVTDAPEVVARFAHEARIHGRLHHRNIVQALDYIVDEGNGRSYFVMEYLTGISIEELLRTVGRIEVESDILSITVQVIEALSHAHKRGVIHRDLKPGNIVLQNTDGELLVKVVDFGIAKVQEEMQRLTKAGVVVGSPIYMSPEQCMGKELDHRADIYSLGILLFELLTGSVPYDGGSLMDVMRAHCDPNRFPGSIKASRSPVRESEQLDAILRKATSTEPQKRFQSVEEFGESLNFWYRSIGTTPSSSMSEPSSRQPCPSSSPSSPEERQLRELIVRSQNDHDPFRKQFTENDFFTALQGESSTRLRLSNSRLALSQSSIVGSTLRNRYRILDLLGEGGMSIVYRALDQTDRQLVAIKTLKYFDPELSARFALEVKIHQELRHPNIVKALDCIETQEGQSFFIMEYLNGVVLQDYLCLQGTIKDTSDFCSVLSQLLNAIEFAHNQGVLHRDIKPDNIFLLKQRNQLRIKVLDFGVAKIQEDLQKITKTGVIVGSPAYMSPEQCLGKQLTFGSDLYSLAVVAYETIAGKLPYSGANEIEIMKAHCDPTRNPVPISRIRTDVPEVDKLSAVLERALAKSADERYQCVEELRQDLHAWWETTEYAGDEATVPPFKPTRRKRKRAQNREEAATAVSTPRSPKESMALDELLRDQRHAQEQSFRSYFEGDRRSFDYGRIIKPLLTILVLAMLLGGAWSAWTYIAAQQLRTGKTSNQVDAQLVPDKPIQMLDESQNTSQTLSGASGSEQRRESSSPLNSNTAGGTRGGGIIRGPNRFSRQ